MREFPREPNCFEILKPRLDLIYECWLDGRPAQWPDLNFRENYGCGRHELHPRAVRGATLSRSSLNCVAEVDITSRLTKPPPKVSAHRRRPRAKCQCRTCSYRLGKASVANAIVAIVPVHPPTSTVMIIAEWRGRRWRSKERRMRRRGRG